MNFTQPRGIAATIGVFFPRERGINMAQLIASVKSAFLAKSFRAAMVVSAAGAGSAAYAGSTGAEFQQIYELFLGWATGFLGKAMAIAAFLLGAGIGVAKQTVLPAILGIVFAVVLAFGPGIINGIVVGTF